MFRFTYVRLLTMLVMFVLFVLTNTAQAQRRGGCNSGVSTDQAQVSANQQLVLQQTAAIAAAQTRQRTVTTSQQVLNSQPLSLTGQQTTCTQCQQTPLVLAPNLNRSVQPVPEAKPQIAAVPKTPPAAPAMMFVRMTPASTPQRPPTDSARYVLMTGHSPEAMRLAAR